MLHSLSHVANRFLEEMYFWSSFLFILIWLLGFLEFISVYFDMVIGIFVPVYLFNYSYDLLFTDQY